MKDINDMIFRQKDAVETFRIKDGDVIIIEGKTYSVTYIDKEHFAVKEGICAPVMATQEATIEVLKKEGFMVGIAEWDTKLGKDANDLLANGHKPEYVFA